jgi:polysaccharide export outer membrane protein
MDVIGLRPGQVQEQLIKRLQDGYLRNPQISVLVKEWNSRKVNVLGQVGKPGPIRLLSADDHRRRDLRRRRFTVIAAKNSVHLRRERNGKVITNSYRVADISEGKAPTSSYFPGTCSW